MLLLAENSNNDWISILVEFLTKLPFPVLVILLGLAFILAGVRVIKVPYLSEGKNTWIAGLIVVSFGFGLLLHNNLKTPISNNLLKEDVWSYKYWIKNERGIHYIHIISANKSANLAFKNYLSKALATGDWPAEPLPEGAFSLTKVTITVE
jgi:hypothetical protein